MTPEELAECKTRIEIFENAQCDINRFEKLLRTLEEISKSGGDHTIGQIIVDVRKSEFRYVDNDDYERIGSNICSLNSDIEQSELFGSFIQWATDQFNGRLAIAKKEMENA